MGRQKGNLSYAGGRNGKLSNSRLDTCISYGYNKTILVKINTSCEGKKYLFAERTESGRAMRGARETDGEYIPELCTEKNFLQGLEKLENQEMS